MLIAIGHILGAFIALAFVNLLMTGVGQRQALRRQDSVARELASKLGVAVDDLYSGHLDHELLRFASERFSSELLRNRFSDLCGILQSAWLVFGTVLQFILLGYAAWAAYFQDIQMARYAWLAVPVALLFWAASSVLSSACLLLTGRYPGEARLARRASVDLVGKQP